jgi:hypothetical protein
MVEKVKECASGSKRVKRKHVSHLDKEIRGSKDTTDSSEYWKSTVFYY